ncbi:MAG: NYN domain-containing protein [Actinomycetales bacterium]
MSSLIVYVDGFNLYHGLKDQFGRRMLWPDLVAFSNRLRPLRSLLQVRYVTAPVLDVPPAASRQGRYQHALPAQNPGLVDIVRGRHQKKPMSCRRCGAGWTHYEEKEADVNIATSLVADAARRQSDSALIISADSDLTPAVKAARGLNPTLFIAAAALPKRPREGPPNMAKPQNSTSRPTTADHARRVSAGQANPGDGQR